MKKCPLCNKEMKDSYAYPGEFVCDCTGPLLGESDLVKHLNKPTRKLKSSIKTGIGKFNIKNRHASGFLIGHASHTQNPILTNKPLIGYDIGSKFINMELSFPLTQGTLSIAIDDTLNSSYLFFKNLEKNNDILFIDCSYKIHKVCNSEIISDKVTISDMYECLLEKIGDYDIIVVNDIHLLDEKQKDSIVPHKSHIIHELYSKKVNAKLKGSRTHVMISALGGELHNGPYRKIKVPSYLSPLENLSSFIFRVRVKSYRDNKGKEMIINVDKNLSKISNKTMFSQSMLDDGTIDELADYLLTFASTEYYKVNQDSSINVGTEVIIIPKILKKGWITKNLEFVKQVINKESN